MAPTNSAALRVKTGPMMTSQTGQALPGVPMNAQQMAEKQHQQQAALERSKLRARKPTDKTMPDGVEDCVMSDGVQQYRDLRDFERRLDATITRKRLDVMDSVNRNAKVRIPRGQFSGKTGSLMLTMPINSASKTCEYGYQIPSRTKHGRAGVSMPKASTFLPTTSRHSKSRSRAAC